MWILKDFLLTGVTACEFVTTLELLGMSSTFKGVVKLMLFWNGYKSAFLIK